jgi:hypothetical protein
MGINARRQSTGQAQPHSPLLAALETAATRSNSGEAEVAACSAQAVAARDAKNFELAVACLDLDILPTAKAGRFSKTAMLPL